MKKDNSIYLQDIVQAIDQIEKYTKDVSFDQFVQEDMRHDAVIRQLEIIGEAANKLSREFHTLHPYFPIQQAIAMRNFLIHGYDEVNLEVVWKILYREFLKPNYFKTKIEFIRNLGSFLLEYNHIRRHGGLKYQIPYEKLKSVTELLD